MLITKTFYRFILVAMQYRVYSRSLTVQGKFVCSWLPSALKLVRAKLYMRRSRGVGGLFKVIL